MAAYKHETLTNGKHNLMHGSNAFSALSFLFSTVMKVKEDFTHT